MCKAEGEEIWLERWKVLFQGIKLLQNFRFSDKYIAEFQSNNCQRQDC